MAAPGFRIELEVFRGPLDLLHYLVRKHEVDIFDIPISLITDQYLAYLNLLAEIDINAVGDFLEMASSLVEMKSRLVLPRSGEVEEELEDPRRDLVRQLLAYKQFKDAASMLDERGRAWQERFKRLASDEPTRQRNLADEQLVEIELWDLVSAFGRVVRENQTRQPSSIVYDDTPIHVFMQRIHGQLVDTGRVAFSALFEPGRHKSTLVGIFLAVLELVRHYQVRAEQDELFSEIWLVGGEGMPREFALPSELISSTTPAGEKPAQPQPGEQAG